MTAAFVCESLEGLAVTGVEFGVWFGLWLGSGRSAIFGSVVVFCCTKTFSLMAVQANGPYGSVEIYSAVQIFDVALVRNSFLAWKILENGGVV
jgi:hypothetical protein